MSTLEQAAAAFDQDLGNSPEASNNDAPVSTIDIEAIFPSRQHENDVVAGGDDLPLAKPAKPVKASVDKAARGVIEGDNDPEEELLYGEDPGADPEDDPAADPEDDDPEDDDPEDGDTQEIPEEILKRTVTVVADGEDVEVTVEEALQGYQRTEVFHRRLNRLTEVAREVETKATEVVAERAKAIELIDQLGTQLAEFLPPEPDWDEQFRVDPTQARKLQKNYTTLKGKLTDLAKKRQEILDQNIADNAKRLEKFILDEKAKVEAANPHWSDPKKRERDLSSMVRTLRAAGFSPDEIKQLYDSRMIAVVLKASKYDRMTAKRPQPSQRGKAPIVKSGAGRVRTAPKVLQRDQARLARTGRLEDAAHVFQQLLK